VGKEAEPLSPLAHSFLASRDDDVVVVRSNKALRPWSVTSMRDYNSDASVDVEIMGFIPPISSSSCRPSSSIRSLRVVLGALVIFVIFFQLGVMISVSRSDNTNTIDEILLAMPHDARRDIHKPLTTSSSYDHRPNKEEARDDTEEEELPPLIINDDTPSTIHTSPLLISPKVVPRIVVVNIQHNNQHAWSTRFFRNTNKRIGYGSGGNGRSSGSSLRDRMSNTQSRLISVHRSDVFHHRSSVHKFNMEDDDATTRFDCPSEYCAPITPNWYDPSGLDYVDGYDTKYCEPMYEWQMSAYPTCNAFHEIHMDRPRRGRWMDVVDLATGTSVAMLQCCVASALLCLLWFPVGWSVVGVQLCAI
jgi:hypothetical protein